MMNKRALLLLLPLLVLVALTACGPKETPEQRLERIRLRHEIRPVGATTVRPPDKEPFTVVDLDLTNLGIDTIPQLTVLVRIRGADGGDKHVERVTLDLSGVRHGTGVQIAASLIGVELAEDDEVLVELESKLSPEELHSLPEWQAVSAAD